MLINVGLRTDIVAVYSEWLFNRLEAGVVYARNPLFPNKVTKYELSPSKVDALLFCSKNYSPLLPRLKEITGKYRTLFHYTITPYGKDIEPFAPDKEEAVETLKELSRAVGKERVVWRFDPVLLTDNYTEERILSSFEGLAREISPFVRGCIFSFVEVFVRLPARMSELLLISSENKRRIAGKLSECAKKFSLPLRSCGLDSDYSEYGIERHGCVTLDDVASANGCAFRAVHHGGNRRGCLCMTSRDIGWYDSCPLGCRYCNANREPAKVKENFLLHDPSSPILIGNLRPDDTVLQSQQNSLLKNDGRQISLFDL